MFHRTLGRWLTIVLMACFVCTLAGRPQVATAEEQTPAKSPEPSAGKTGEEGRKVKTKVPPVYPQLARAMHVTGIVRVLVVVTPAGTVKSVKVIGGHPLLVESVTDAVKRWKYEAASQESTTVVEFKFFDEGS